MSMPPPSSPQRGAVLAMLVTIVLWAYSWIVMKQVLAYAGPFDFAALRYLLGAAVLFAALLLSGRSLRPPPLGPTILIGLCQTAAFQGLEQWALLDGGAGHVALLAYTMPFWAVLLAWLMLGDRPTPRHWLGLALAAAGLLCIIEPWHAMGSVPSTTLAITGGVAWAAGTVLTKRLFQRHAPDVLSLTAWQMLVGGVALGLIALVVPQRPIVCLELGLHRRPRLQRGAGVGRGLVAVVDRAAAAVHHRGQRGQSRRAGAQRAAGVAGAA
ncbi:hypothetical protein RLIN73S_07180 [Rhodanobacter lindaniclasticus]